MTRKATFFQGSPWIKFKNLGLALVMALNLHKCGKKLETKSQNLSGANSWVCRGYRGKTGRGSLLTPPILNRIKTLYLTIFPKKAKLQFLEIYFLVVILRIWLRFGILTKP